MWSALLKPKNSSFTAFKRIELDDLLEDRITIAPMRLDTFRRFVTSREYSANNLDFYEDIKRLRRLCDDIEARSRRGNGGTGGSSMAGGNRASTGTTNTSTAASVAMAADGNSNQQNSKNSGPAHHPQSQRLGHLVLTNAVTTHSGANSQGDLRRSRLVMTSAADINNYSSTVPRPGTAATATTISPNGSRHSTLRGSYKEIPASAAASPRGSVALAVGPAKATVQQTAASPAHSVEHIGGSAALARPPVTAASTGTTAQASSPPRRSGLGREMQLPPSASATSSATSSAGAEDGKQTPRKSDQQQPPMPPTPAEMSRLPIPSSIKLENLEAQMRAAIQRVVPPKSLSGGGLSLLSHRDDSSTSVVTAATAPDQPPLSLQHQKNHQPHTPPSPLFEGASGGDALDLERFTLTIIQTYLIPGGEKEMNVDEVQRHEIYYDVLFRKIYHPTIFQSVLEQATHVMRHQSFPNFLKECALLMCEEMVLFKGLIYDDQCGTGGARNSAASSRRSLAKAEASAAVSQSRRQSPGIATEATQWALNAKLMPDAYSFMTRGLGVKEFRAVANERHYAALKKLARAYQQPDQ